MKKGVKRAVAAVTALVLAFSFAGCGKKEESSSGSSVKVAKTGFPIVEEPVTLNVMAAKFASHSDWKDMMLWKEYEKMTGIHIEWQCVPTESIAEKKNIALASGDIPDIFYRTYMSQQEIITNGQQGVFIPLNDLIDEYAPNLKALMESRPDIKRVITQSDGNIYSLPLVTEDIMTIAMKGWINQKWLDKLGMKNPENTDEFYKVLKAFKEKDPNGNGKADEIPLSGWSIKELMKTLSGSFGIANKGADLAASFFDAGADGKMRCYAKTNEFKNMLMYINKLWNEGLLDQEILTQQTPQFTAKSEQNRVGACLQGNSPIAFGNKYLNDYVALNPLKGKNGEVMTTNIGSGIIDGTFVITKANKNPEASMRWIDYFYGDEGTRMLRMGFEGVTYTVDENGEYQYTDDIVNNPDGLDLDQAVGKFTVWPGGGHAGVNMTKYMKSSATWPVSLEANELYRKFIPQEICQFTFAIDEIQNMTKYAQITPYINECAAQFIIGKKSFDEWDSYVAELEKMDVKGLEAIYQKAYERWKNLN